MSNTSIFIPQEMIRTKRDGGIIAKEDIVSFVAGITDGSVTDAQISAFAMAVFFTDMSPDEGAALTLAMRDSGDVIDWTKYGFDKDAPIVDKHSTGGVGDKVSLMLAPIVAACGAYVPMISGRGLGHTGGTLDKLEAIPGYDPYPTIARFAEIQRKVGCSVIGQTAALAPADRRFYGIRDVTATVESIPLITASILSKKLSAGLRGLVMDVKFGNGAFMQTAEEARLLATNIVRVAAAANTPTVALLTDMNQVLGTTAGNAVEMVETIEFLTNPATADARLLDVTLDLAAHMLCISGAKTDLADARKSAEIALNTGKAAEVFSQMLAEQGGPVDFMEHSEKYLKIAKNEKVILAESDGFVSAMDTRAIGMAVVALGGGRTDPAQKIDHSVGFTEICQIGDKVKQGQPLARVFATTEDAASAAVATFTSAVQISTTALSIKPITAEIIRG